MQTVTLDFSNCKYIYDIHMVIQNALEFPEYYGKNLDALWDFGQDYALSYDKVTLIIKGANSVPEDLEESIIEILEVFGEIHNDCPNFTFTIA